MPAGITQDQIDETRGQRERLMLNELSGKLEELAAGAGAGAGGTLPNGDLAHAHPSAASLRRLAAHLFDVEFVEKYNVAPVRLVSPSPITAHHLALCTSLSVELRALLSSKLSGCASCLVERDDNANVAAAPRLPSPRLHRSLLQSAPSVLCSETEKTDGQMNHCSARLRDGLVAI